MGFNSAFKGLKKVVCRVGTETKVGGLDVELMYCGWKQQEILVEIL